MDALTTTLVISMLTVVGLLGAGLFGLVTVRNLIKVVIALQILAKAAILALAVAGQASGQPVLGQSLAVTVIVADTVVAVVGLALTVQVNRRFGTLDIRALSHLKE